MKEFLDGFDIANTIRMMRPVHTGTFLIVEGDSDARVYGRFIDVTVCTLIVAQGKSNALTAMDILERDNFEGVVAIVDSDFSRLDGIQWTNPDIMVTDTHDLETMIITSPALDTVLMEFGSPRKLNHLDHPVRKVLARVAMPLGYLRWISSSKQENLALNFKDVAYDTFIEVDRGTLKTNLNTYIEELRKQSHLSPQKSHDLKIRVITLMKSNEHDPWHVCRGHDVVHILTIGLRQVFGNRNARAMGYDQVDRILRIAYGFVEFSKTHLYSALRQWEHNHPAYRVFAHETTG